MSNAVRHTNFKIQPYLKDVTEIKERVPGMFSIIVTCYNEPKELIERSLKSLVEDTYENKEILVCFDRDDHEGYSALVEQFKEHKNVMFYMHPNMGSSGNKNYGLLRSKGEFIACFAGDMILNTGAISTFVEQFNQNPDVAIVYTGYEFLRRKDEKSGLFLKLEPFPSYPTDAKMITYVNAIDASMPQRYEYAILFDDAFKSLGDWDWAITHLKHYGHKVHYCKFFNAYKHSIPFADGLSNHSHSNWEELIGFLNKKHNISAYETKTNIFSADMCVHSKKLSELTGWDRNFNVIGKTYNYKDCLILGFYRKHWDSYFAMINNNPKTKFSVLFLGSDIAVMHYHPYQEAEFLAEYFEKRNIKVYTECGRSRKELLKFGIDSAIMPLPVVNPEADVTVKTKEFTTAVYAPNVPKEELEKYAIPFMLRLFQILPNFKFLVYGGQEVPEKSLPNVEFVGFRAMKEVIEKSDVLLRILPFDGLAISAIEFMMCGKPVITNNAYDGATVIKLGRNFQFVPEEAQEAYNKIINELYEARAKYKGEVLCTITPKPFEASEYTLEKFLSRYNGGK